MIFQNKIKEIVASQNSYDVVEDEPYPQYDVATQQQQQQQPEVKKTMSPRTKRVRFFLFK